MTVRSASAKGFTLVEVLVALAVVSIALAALSGAGSRVLATQEALQTRTLAFWVADNRLAELRFVETLQPGGSEGSSRMAGRDWRWQQRVQAAPGGDLWRVDVTVFDASDRPQITHTGFFPR